MGRKGGKRFKRKRKDNLKGNEMEYKDESQEYGKVKKVCGNGRFDVVCFDGKERKCHVRGKLRRRMWVNLDCIVLVSLRDYQEEKGDIIFVYNNNQAKILKNNGHIPPSIELDDEKAEETKEFEKNLEEIKFENEDDDKNPWYSSGSGNENEKNEENLDDFIDNL